MTITGRARTFSDGGARGNPGPAAIGIVIFDADGNRLQTYNECIGDCTNNQAEYKALTKALELAAAHCETELECFLDSELVVRQLSGEYKLKNEGLKSLFCVLKEKEAAFKSVAYTHVPRSNMHIQLADRLVNEALDRA